MFTIDAFKWLFDHRLALIAGGGGGGGGAAHRLENTFTLMGSGIERWG